MEIFNQFLIVDNFLLNAFTDVKSSSLDLGLRSSLNFCDVEVLSCQASYDFLLASFCCRCCCACCNFSASRYRNCCCAACSKCSNRDLKVDVLSFSDVDLKNSACCRCCRCNRCRCCRSLRSCFLFFLCRCARCFYSVQYICC